MAFLLLSLSKAPTAAFLSRSSAAAPIFCSPSFSLRPISVASESVLPLQAAPEKTSSRKTKAAGGSQHAPEPVPDETNNDLRHDDLERVTPPPIYQSTVTRRRSSRTLSVSELRAAVFTYRITAWPAAPHALEKLCAQAEGLRRRFWMVEFGAIRVCPRKLVEIGSYITLIRPGDLSAVSATSTRKCGITREAVSAAPPFEEVAGNIFDILNGRVWAGHNIQRFDSARIREAFDEIGGPAPVPVGMIDSLAILGRQFGKRAGNLKMATLATYSQTTTS